MTTSLKKNNVFNLTRSNKALLRRIFNTGPYNADRPIRTVFYGNPEATIIVKTNNAKHARKAVLNATDHMQINQYGAFVAEVYDMETSELFAVITRSITTGELNIKHYGDPLHPKCRFKMNHE